MSKIGLKKMMRDFTNLKEKLQAYQASVGQSMYNDFADLLPRDMYNEIEAQIERGIQVLTDEFKELGSKITKLSHRVLSLNSKVATRALSQSLKMRQQAANRKGAKFQGAPTASAAKLLGHQSSQGNEDRQSMLSSQVSLANYNPIRKRQENSANVQKLLGCSPNALGVDNSSREFGIQQTTQETTLINIPIGQQMILEPQSVPYTEDSSSQRNGKANEDHFQGPPSSELGRGRRSSQKPARSQ